MMIKYATRFAKQIKLARLDPVRNFARLYNNKDDEANRITALDRLILMKPAISQEEDDGYEALPEDAPVELDGEPDPRLGLSKELMKLGRVYYRHIADRPAWFQERKDEICSNRTAPQIRRCLKDWMLKMERVDVGKYINKAIIFGDQMGVSQKINTAFAYGPEETVAYAHYFMPSRYAITERIFKELKNTNPNFAPKRIIDFGCGPATGAAAAHAVWGDDITKYTGIDMSQSMLDAARIMTTGIIRDTQFYDKTAEVIKRAEQHGERYDLAICSYTLTELVSDPSRRAAVQIMFELLDAGGHLVILEAGNPRGSNIARSARQLVLDIFNNTNKQGRAVNLPTSTYNLEDESAIAEAALASETNEDEFDDDEEEDEEEVDKNADSATKEARAAAAKQKRILRNKNKKIRQKTTALILPPPMGYAHDELGATVVAPCTHDKVCPLAPRQFCTFSQKVYSGMIRKESQEKFSYVVLQKRTRLPSPGKKATAPPANDEPKRNAETFGVWTEPLSSIKKSQSENPQVEPGVPTPLNVLQRFVGIEEDEVQDVVDKLIDDVDWTNYQPPLYREEYGRLLRSPLKMKGHVTMDLCHPSGSLIRNTVSRGNLLQVPSLYVALRKTSWGGLFPCLLDNDEKSALAVKAKGNRGAVGEGRQVNRIMVDGEEEEDEDVAEVADDVYGFQELREGGRGGGGRQSRRMSRSEREAEAAAAEEEEQQQEEQEEEDVKKSKKRKGGRQAVKVLIPGSPEAKAFEEKMLLRRRNEFTNRPVDKDTWYPEVESVNMRRMDRKAMARYTSRMPEYADGIKYEDVKAAKEKEPVRKGRRVTSGLGSVMSKLKQKRQQSGSASVEKEESD